ncbi:MAG: hypothetical protein P4L10_01360 [Acidobacteriaceae bacterium]|nr:hypothetical protein [Acidobacteriaceae bacterium]
MGIEKRTRPQLSALNERLNLLTAQVRKHEPSPRKLRALLKQREALLRAIYSERRRVRVPLLSVAGILAELRKSKNLSAKQRFSIQVAEELLLVSPTEDILYAMRQIHT